MPRTWEDNADEYRALGKGAGWPFARLIACSVEKGKVGRPKKVTYVTIKVTASAFADRAGETVPRVLRHLDAWNRAADQGLVKHADDLGPDNTDTDYPKDPDQSWVKPDGSFRFTEGRKQPSVRVPPKPKQGETPASSAKPGISGATREGATRWSKAVQDITLKCPMDDMTNEEVDELRGAAKTLFDRCHGTLILRGNDHGSG